MICPACRTQARVGETRVLGMFVRRKRYCTSESCDFHWSTIEIPVGKTFDFRIKVGPGGLEVARKADEQT